MIRILRGFSLGGGIDVAPGQEVPDDLIPPALKKQYLHLGKIAPIEPEHDHENIAPPVTRGRRRKA